MCLHAVYKSPRHQFAHGPLDETGRRDLQWWASLSDRSKELHLPPPTRTISTDASSNGWGASMGCLNQSGLWSREESKLHINILEMMAVHNALRIWAPQIRGDVVSLHTDNKTVVAYLQKEGGTKSRQLCLKTAQILALCRKWGIILRPAYLPGMANLAADALSRRQIVKEWHLSPVVVTRIFRRWGIPQVDAVASRQTAQLSTYFTLDRRDRKAAAVDAFCQPWTARLMYAFPPPQLIPQVLAKVMRDRAEMILIAPCWEDATWFSKILSLLVDHPRRLPPRPDLVRVVQTQQPPNKISQLRLTAWRISGNELHKMESHKKWLPSCNALSDNPHLNPTSQHGNLGNNGAVTDTWTLLRLL